MDLNTAAVFLALVAGSFAGPVLPLSSSDACARQCTESSKFLYEPGTVYEFQYEGKTSTGIHGASEDNAGLKITSKASIGVVSKCEFTLELSNTVLYGANPDWPERLNRHSDSNAFRRALQNNPLRFSFQDGIIDELCPSDDEPIWVLNIKRGILSAFQNGMDSLDQSHEETETDVTGSCPTTYKMTQDGWRTRTIKKTRDINSCTDRHGFDSTAHPILYNVPSSIQNLPLMKSTHECDQEINVREKILKLVVCHEVHLFRPFSKEDNGATTEVVQKLRFVSSESRQVRQGNIGRRTTILFEHEEGERLTTVNYQGALSKLTELCSSTQTDIRPETPALFSELVYELKKLDASSLNSVYQRVSDRSFCPDNSERVKKFYLDAIPMVGTGASISQITERIMNNDISATFVEMWLASLSFVQHPTKEMLAEVQRLLDMPNGDKVILPVSSLVHTYCRNNADCGDEMEVEDIMTWLETKIGSSCQYSDSNNNYMQVLLSLRAVGNIGLSRSMIPSLQSCFSSDARTMEIRIAAVEAFRRFPCTDDRRELMALYRDSNEDSEIRIGAYLQVMKCANADTITQVKEMLASEEVNQVGSFVWTHLTNLMETSDPTKQEIRAILEDEVLQREFDMDRRKFSRNYEMSYFSEKFNLGGSMESNLVWSPQSFVPRSLMANLTVDLFGHSYNLLEIGGRVEGLEHLLEAYFGPSGHLNDNKIPSPAPEPPTNKAYSMNKLNRMGNKISSDEELQGSMYMRVFGNEVKYMNLKKMQQTDTSQDNFNFDAFFARLIRDGSVSYTYSDMFLDSSIIIPTLVGFPLNLTVNGTLTTGLTGTGRVDLRRPKSLMLLDGNIEPSGAVAISAMMSVDAFVTKGGMKMVSTLHTSTAIRGKLELSNNRDFTLELDFPRQKSEVISMESSFFMVQGYQEKVQAMLDKNVASTSFCTGNTLARISGLNTCIRTSIPTTTNDSPHFPFTGPVSIKVETMNEDLPSGYKFELRRSMTDEETVFLVSYDTPGSRTDRAIGFNLNIQHVAKTMEINLISPWKKATFTGNIVYTVPVKKVEGNLLVDDVRTYSALFEIQRREQRQLIKYTPNILLTFHGKRSFSLTGNVDYLKQKSLTGDLQLTGLHSETITLNGALVSTGRRKKFEWNVMIGDIKTYAFLVDLPFTEAGNSMKFNPVISATIPGFKEYNSTGSLEYRRNKLMKADIAVHGFTEDPMVFSSLVKFIPTEKSVKVKFSYENDKNYEGEMKMMTRVMKSKSTQYNGILALKTPTKFLIQAKTRLVYKPEVSAKYDLVVDKIVKVPIRIKGSILKTSKRLRTFYRGIVRYTGPKKTDVRLRMDLDKRQNALFANTKISYNFLKLFTGAKDQLDFNWKAIRSLKTVQTMELATNFKSSRYSAYNNKMTLKGSYRPGKLVDGALIFDHGRNYLNKDNKKRVTFNAQTSFQVRKRTATVAYSFSCRYPWQTLSVALSGNHFHDASTVNSSLSIMHNTKPLFSAAAQYNDNSRNRQPNYSGELSMDINGRPIAINAQVTEVREKEYQGTLRVQHERKKITTLTATYKGLKESSFEFNTALELYDRKRTQVSVIYSNPSNTSYRVSSSVQWYDGTSFSSQGSLSLDRDSPLVSLSLAFGANNYALSLSGENKPTYRRVASDILYPARHIIVELGAGMKQNKYMVLGDVQWDADSHPDSRIKVEGSYRNEGAQNFETGALVQLPGHLYSALIRHLSTTKYNTAVEFAWAPGKKIGVEFEFQDTDRRYRRDLKAMAGFSTPFEHFEEMQATVIYKSNKNQLTSSVAFKYAAGKTLSLAVTAKKPVTINSVNLKFIMGTPHPKVGEATLSISHLLSEDMNHHTAESTLQWGTDSQVYLETTSEYQGNRRTRTYRRNIGFQSTIPTWELVTLNITHMDDFRQFDSKAIYTRNEEVYHYHMIHDFTIRGIQIQNSGTFNITSPKDSLHLVWSHENTDRNIDSSATVVWNKGQRFSTSVYGDIQYSPTMRITGRFDAEIPSPQLNRIRARFEHADRPGVIRTNGHIHADGENIVTVQANYGRQLGSVDYDMLLTSVYMRQDFKTNLRTRHAVMPYTGELEIEWHPQQKINLDGSLNYDLQIRKVDGRMTLATPFTYARRIIISADHRMDGLEWVATGDVEFAPQRNIITEARYRFDDLVKLGRFTLTTPMPQLQRIDAGVQYTGHLADFGAVANLEVAPYFTRHEISANWLRNQFQLKGDFDVKNARFSYTNGQFTSNVSGRSRTSSAVFEFLDQKIMRPQRMVLDSDYRLRGDTVVGTIKFVCPYTQPINIEYTQSGDLHDFNERATIRYGGNKQITSNLEFGDNPNIHGKLTLSTPYRGTEEVELGFVHDGSEWQKFNTAAVYGTNGKKIEFDVGLNIVDTLSGKFAIKSPFPVIQVAQVAFSHEGNLAGLKSHGEAIYNEYVVEGDATLQHDSTVTTGTFIFKSPIPNAEELVFRFSKDGNPNRFMVHTEALKNLQKVELDVNFDHNDRTTSGTVSGKTNLDSTEDITLTFSRDGYLTDFTAESSVAYGADKVESLVGFSHNDQTTTGRMVVRGVDIFIEGDVEDVTVSFTGTGSILNFQNEAEVWYGQQKTKTTAQLAHSTTETLAVWTLTSDFLTEFRDVAITLNKVGEGATMSVNGTIVLDQNKVETHAGYVFNENVISGRFELESTFPQIKPVTVSFKKEGSLPSNFKTSGLVNYDQINIGTDIEFSLDDAAMSSKFHLLSNIPDVKDVTMTLTRQGTLESGFVSNGLVEYDQTRLGAALEFSHDESTTTGKIELTSNIPEIKGMSLTFSREGVWTSFTTRASGTYDQYNLQTELNFSHIDTTTSGKVAMNNNFLKKNAMEIAFTKDGGLENLRSHGQIVCDDDRFEIDLVLAHERTTTTGSLSTTCTLEEVKDVTVSLTRTAARGGKSDSVRADATYGTRRYTLSLDKKVVGNDVVITGTITNPDTEDITFSIDHNSRKRGFNTVVSGAMGTDYSINHRSEYTNKKNVLDFSFVSTAVIHGERITEKFNLEHTGEPSDFQSHIVYIYNENKIDATLTVSVPSISNAQINLVATTTFENYTDISLAFRNRKRGSTHVGNFDMTYSSDRTISATSSIDIESPQKTISITFRSPFEHFESADLDVTHTGDSALDFETVAVLQSSELTSPLRAEVTLNYEHLINIDASAKISYNEHNRQLVLTIEQEDSRLATRVVLQPSESQAITLEAGGHFIWIGDSYPNHDINFNMKLLTPFECIRNLVVKYESSSSMSETGKTQLESTLVTYNDVMYYEKQSSGLSENGQFNVTVREASDALAFEYRYNLFFNIPLTSVNVDAVLNWDNTSPTSNFHLIGSASVERSQEVVQTVEASLQGIHPSRTVGLKGGWTREFFAMPNHMEVSWDENRGQKAGYEIQWSSEGRLVKVMTPVRSMELRAEVNENQLTKVREYELFWDAERDRSQHASVRLEKTSSRRDTIRMGINVPTDSGIKEFSMYSELDRQDNGYFNSRTELTYSSDPSKTVVMTASYEDLPAGSNKNCSFSIGLSHAHSNLDLSGVAHVARGTEKQSAGLHLSTLTSQQQRKNLLLMGEIDMLQKHMNVLMIGPSKAVGLTGEMSESPRIIAVRSTHDAENLIDVQMTYDPQSKLMHMEMKYDEEHPNRMLHLTATYPNNLDFTTEMYRTGDFPKVSETLLNLHLKSSHLLHTKLQWRPEMLSDLMDYTSQSIEKYGSEVNTVLSDSAIELGNELETRLNLLSNEIQVELEPVAGHYVEEIEAVHVQLRKIKQTMNEMYKTNRLHLRDINEQLQGSIQKFLVQYGKAVSSFGRSARSIRQKLSEITNEIQTYPFEEKYNEQVELMTSRLQEARQQLENMLNTEKDVIVEKMTETLEKIREYLIEMVEMLSQTVSKSVDKVVKHPDVQKAKQQLAEILARLPESPQLPDINYKAYMNKLRKTVTTRLQNIKLAEQYSNIVQGTNTALADQFTGLLENEDVAKLKELTMELYSLLLSASNKWPLTSSLREIAADFYESSKEFITEDIGKLKFLNWHKNRIIVFEPENGHIEFEVYLLSPASALDRIPKFNFRKYVNRVTTVWERYVMQLRDLSFWDIYYKYMPSCNPRDWIPPFKAHAIIAGSRHFVTFDNQRLEVAGMCSYVLTHDFHDNNFSVIVNFNRNRQQPKIRSLLVMAEGKNIEIFPSSGIHIDGRPSELPLKHGELSVYRYGNLVILDSGRGLEVRGDVEREHFVITISGWYFGKVAGLLGTYNYETYDDKTKIDGTVTDSVDSFVQSWQMNKRCKLPGNLADQVTYDDQSAGYSQCAALFKDSSSPLRPCFKQVDPEDYMHMCLSNIQRGEKVCDVASVYVTACQKNLVNIWLPKQCIQCETPVSDRFHAGETIKLSPASDDYQVPQSADIVFVVESRQCNQEIAGNLGNFVYKVEQILGQSQITDNRYGLVSYGQDGARSHTMEGDFFNDATKFVKGAEMLTFSDESSSSLAAIHTATLYPFRTGVSKTIFLVQCDECPGERSVLSDHLKHVLSTRGITLHILQDQEFRLANNRIPKHKILGVDNSRKYLLDQDHASLYDDMALPSDSCSALSLSTNGAIFDSTGFTLRKLRNRKMFSQIVAQAVVSSAVPPDCQVCHCVSDETGAPISVCRKCYSSISDYLPQMWNNHKHPLKIRSEFEQQLKDYLGNDVFSS